MAVPNDRSKPSAGRGPTPPAEVIRGLPTVDRLRPAGVVLGSIAWDGGPPDPARTPAGDFLGWLE